MSNKAKGKKGTQPKLRFPEFRYTEGWREVVLSDILTEHKAKNDGKCKVHSVSVHKGIIDQVEHLGRSFAASDTSKYNLVKPFDIVYTKSPTGDFPFGIIKQNQLDKNVIVSPLYGVFSPQNKYLGYILDSYFESPKRTKNYLDPIVQKGAKNTIQISNETFLSKGIYLPENEVEQQKIADCLLSLNELIMMEAQKLSALNDHKKGLMQELFPAENQSLPNHRFPKFKNASEWKKIRMGALVDIRSGFSPSRYNLSVKGKYAFLKVEDLNNCKKYQSQSREYSDDMHGLIPAKSIIFPKRGAAILLNKVRINLKEVLMDTNLMAITPNKKVMLEFLYYKIISEGLNKIADTSTIPQINNKHIIPYSILVPSEAEQKEIGDCLSSIDDSIIAQSQKLDALRDHKKGLMQQLFPAASEVQE